MDHTSAGVFNAAEWGSFAACLHSQAMDLTDPATFSALKRS